MIRTHARTHKHTHTNTSTLITEEVIGTEIGGQRLAVWSRRHSPPMVPMASIDLQDI